jgi:hypothetical protein
MPEQSCDCTTQTKLRIADDKRTLKKKSKRTCPDVSFGGLAFFPLPFVPASNLARVYQSAIDNTRRWRNVLHHVLESN